MKRAVVLFIVLVGCVAGGEEDPEVAESTAAIAVCGGSLQAAINAAPQDAVLDICAGTYIQITGITFRDGNTPSVGAGVACRNATLTVRDSVFLENRGDRGAGLYAGPCVLDIKRSRFEANYANEGGGITTLEGTILI